MTKTVEKSSWKSTFFNNPIKTSFGVFALTSLGLATTLCIVLIPINLERKSTQADLNEASETFVRAQIAFLKLLADIQEAQARVENLYCVMGIEKQYKLEVSQFFQNLTASTIPASDKLAQFWNLVFKPDWTVRVASTSRKSYEVSYIDGEGNTAYTTEYYDETTTVDLIFRNIIILSNGTFPVPRMSCGFYASEVQLIPESYITSTSPSTTSGTKESRFVDIDYNEYYGSLLKFNSQVEGQHSSQQIIVPREATKLEAANSLVAEVFKLFSAFVMAVTTTSTNYLELQQKINGTIPGLQSQVPGLNATALEMQQIFEDTQAEYNQVDEHYHTALNIWLPMLIIPFVLALSTCLFLKFCKNRCMYSESQDVEMRGSSLAAN